MLTHLEELLVDLGELSAELEQRGLGRIARLGQRGYDQRKPPQVQGVLAQLGQHGGVQAGVGLLAAVQKLQRSQDLGVDRVLIGRVGAHQPQDSAATGATDQSRFGTSRRRRPALEQLG